MKKTLLAAVALAITLMIVQYQFEATEGLPYLVFHADFPTGRTIRIAK
jgi:hypothetical protein